MLRALILSFSMVLMALGAQAQRGTVKLQPSDNGFVTPTASSSAATASAPSTTVDDLTAQTNAVNVELPQVKTNLDQANVDLISAQNAAQGAQSDYNAAKAQFHNEAGYWPTDLGGGNGTATTRQALADAKAKLDQANKDLNNAQASVSQLSSDSKKLAASAAKNSQQTDKAIKALGAALQGNGLVSDFAILKAKAGSINTALDIMNQQLDKAALGAYLKDKMTAMLSSPLMCEAVKSCPRSATKVPATDVEKYLFPNTSGSTRAQNSSDGTK